LLDAASDAADAWAEAPFEAGHDEASEAEASPEADGPDVVEPPRPLLGIYALSGSVSRWGSYHGKAEIREGPGGTLSVHHVQEYDTAEFEGDRVALAWEGSAEQPASPAGPYSLSVRLAPVGFIKTWKNETREGSDPTPWLFTASFDRTAPDTLQGTFASQQGLSFTESWSWLSGSAPEPL
jgi:hypothetical protein